MTLGADGAASAVPTAVGGAAALDLPRAVPVFVAACARLAAEAAASGDFAGARRLLHMALSCLGS